MKVIALINQKGGVGKTTVVLQLASYLVSKGHKVLTIDFDPQGNCSKSFGVNTDGLATIKEVMLKEVNVTDAVLRTKYGDIIPADIILGQALTIIDGMTAKEKRLANVIKPIADNYDYILIDCPPAFNVFTYNALVFATDVLLPCKTDEFSKDGAEQFFVIAKDVEESFDKKLNIIGFLLNQVQEHLKITKLYTDIFEDLAKEKKTRVLKNAIRQSTDIPVAQALCQSIFDYKPKSKVAEDWKLAIEEILKNTKGDK